MTEPSLAEWGMQNTQRRREARVYTNRTCNQNCGFCNRRSPREKPEFVRPRAVRERIDGAADACVVLTGGEPTLRRDLVDMVAYACGTQGRSVHLETNATLIDAHYARRLAEAGLSLARVHLPAWGEDADRITNDPGGFRAALAGLHALADAGVRLEVSTPLVSKNASLVMDMPQQLSGLPVETWVVGIPFEASDSASLLSLSDAALTLDALVRQCQRWRVSLRLDPHTVLPPCIFPEPKRLSRLFALTRGGKDRQGYAQKAECTSCTLVDRCPGLPNPHLDHPLRPIRDDRVRRRLSLLSTVKEQIERELYQDEIKRDLAGGMVVCRSVRIGFRCNQSCAFCFVSTHLPDADDAMVEAAIVDAARRNAEIALSGGEPTLHPRLLDFLELAKREGASAVELQTNATRIDEPLAKGLKDRGLDLAFVSLHAEHAALSDSITGAPGTFDKTVRGIEALQRAGVPVRVNWVFHQANLRYFKAFVVFVAERFPEAEVSVSFVAPSTDLVPRTKQLIPRYTEVLPHLSAGMAEAKRRGIRLNGFESMCGLPLCLVPEELNPWMHMSEAPDGYVGGETVWAEACEACTLRGRCFGLRRGYAELYGTGELRTVRGAGELGTADFREETP
ncbi:MAG: radical SAM protein [Myxococcota bacterium]